MAASSTSVHGRLYRMTCPSRRTYLVVETPTLAVCGAIGLPISAPTEFSDGSSSGGMCSSPPTEYWNEPNSALVDVLLPDSATPIQPTIGARIRNVGPIWANPCAIVLAMPDQLNTSASPKMIGATSSAPHICENVVRKISASCAGRTRCTTTMISQDTKIQVPAIAGANDQDTLLALWDSELTADTVGFTKL